MRMKFEYRPVASLPKLAWCARIKKDGQTAVVWHGPDVETFDDFFCEGAWNGPFEEGRFDEAHTFLGSGGRITSRGFLFASPAHNSERIFSARQDEVLLVSNSWVFILSQLGDEPDPAYQNYERDMRHYYKVGIAYTNKWLKTRDGHRVYLHDCCNLLVTSPPAVERLEKPLCIRPSSFASYKAILQTTIAETSANAAHSLRRKRYGPVAMISRGYDTTAAASLAAEVGCERAVTFSHPNADDDGSAIAASLGMEVRGFGRFDYMDLPGLPEAEHFASMPFSTWIPVSGMEEAISGSLLFNGIRGDSTWSLDESMAMPLFTKREPVYVTDSSMTEFRLRAGFISFPVPYIGALHSRAILELSRSAELKPWSIGGEYDRPLPRRIAEEAGVPREMFGQAKQMSAHLVLRKLAQLSSASCEDYMAFQAADARCNARRERTVAYTRKRRQLEARLWRSLEQRRIELYHPIFPAVRSLLAGSYRKRDDAFCPSLFHWGFARTKDRYRVG